MARKKILFVITQGAWGGAQRYIFDLATHVADDFDVTVAIGEPKGKKDLQAKFSEAKTAIRVVQLRHLVRPVSFVHDVLALFELRNLCQKLQPDILHLNSSKAEIIGLLAKRLGYIQCPTVVTVHGWIFNEPLSFIKKQTYLFLEKITAAARSASIVLSETEKQQGVDILHILPERLHCIPHGIADFDMLSKNEARSLILSKAKQPIPEDTPLVGVIANYFETKGLDILIQAVALNKDLQNFPFFLIGEGPERGRLQALIEHYMLKNMFLLGEIIDASRYIPAFEVLALPSRKEGLPYVVIEALAQEVPLVATSVGGVPSIVEDKKTGLLVPPNDPFKLGDAILSVLQNPKQLQPSSYKFSLAEEVIKTTSLYRELLAERLA